MCVYFYCSPSIYSPVFLNIAFAASPHLLLT